MLGIELNLKVATASAKSQREHQHSEFVISCVTSSPARRSSSISVRNLIFMPLTWLQRTATALRRLKTETQPGWMQLGCRNAGQPKGGVASAPEGRGLNEDCHTRRSGGSIPVSGL
jgi:hypothetical protein